MYMKLFVASLVAGTLVGCGGTDSSGNSGNAGGSSKAPTEEFILKTIADISNSQQIETGYVFPDNAYIDVNDEYQCRTMFCAYKEGTGVSREGMTRRYAISQNDSDISKIPVYYNDPDGKHVKDPRFEYAMKEIASIVAPNKSWTDIFDVKGFSQLPDHYELQKDYTGLDAQGGIIFSLGTATMHGNVSSGPNSGNLAGVLVDNESVLLGDKGWTWLNLDSPVGLCHNLKDQSAVNNEGTCIASNEVAIHEFAHIFFAGRMYENNLGYSGHFPGFGADGGVFDERAKAVLRTLYANPTNTPVESVEVKLN
ncbi:hypothetical protein [Photobacterium sp. DNB22_13_2]